MKDYTLGNVDIQKIGKGALIAIIGALLTYLTTVITHTDFGTYTTIVMAFWSVATNVAWKILDGQSQ